MKRRSIWVIEYRRRGSKETWTPEALFFIDRKHAQAKATVGNRLWEKIVHRVVRYDASK
jgi:hypothetical protein